MWMHGNFLHSRWNFSIYRGIPHVCEYLQESGCLPDDLKEYDLWNMNYRSGGKIPQLNLTVPYPKDVSWDQWCNRLVPHIQQLWKPNEMSVVALLQGGKMLLISRFKGSEWLEAACSCSCRKVVAWVNSICCLQLLSYEPHHLERVSVSKMTLFAKHLLILEFCEDGSKRIEGLPCICPSVCSYRPPDLKLSAVRFDHNHR